jgi:hypothetical protein
MNIRDVDTKVLELMLEDFYEWWRDDRNDIYQAVEFYIPFWREEVGSYKNVVNKGFIRRNGVLITLN